MIMSTVTATATTTPKNSNNGNVMTLVGRAAELNEDGVYELADGSFPDAVQSFENAVRQMMQVCEQTTQAHHQYQQQQQQQESQQQPQGSSHDCCTNNTSSKASTQQQPQQPQQQEEEDTVMSDAPDASVTPAARSSVEVPYLKDDRFYIYSCTVTFHPVGTPSSTAVSVIPSSAEIAFYCATILFNLALAHHQHGQRCSEASPERTAALRQALVLYQEAAKALQTLQQRMTPATAASLCFADDDLVLMTLAIHNNQACIWTALNDRPAAEAAFQQILVQSRIALDDPTSNLSLFEQSQLQEFLRNAMVFLGSLLLQDGTTLPHPAAACA